ncbi:MAG: RNA polymerase sigma factor [Calditrichaeota bacterium]|nr:RNA polymerase sigma factor [Calditrichota bacterium]
MENKEQYFLDIYQQFKDKLFRLCLGFTGDTGEAENLFQEIWIKIWNHLDQFRNESAIGTWIYRIATNTALLYVKRQNRYKRKVQSMEHLPVEPGGDPSEAQHMEEAIARLYRAIASLKELDRIIIELVLEGTRYRDIAEITGLSVSNVGVRINRIKKELKNRLEKAGE